MTQKIITIVGTRPEIIKLSRVISSMDSHFNHLLVHTGQNYDYELNEIFFKQLEIREPDYYLEAVSDSPAHAIGNIISKVDEILEKEQPDAILLLGDTNSCLSAIAAKRRKIPIFHMEAGNRCFDDRVPEEINRRIVDHISDVNLVYTEHARRYLIREGLKQELIVKTGSPMKEVLNYYESGIQSSGVLELLDVEKYDYILVSAHREENIDSDINFNNLIATLNTLAEEYKKKVIVSTHPRTQKRIDQKKIKASKLIDFVKPLGFLDYIALQKNAYCVVSDSGTITEESSILSFPAVTIRQAHERPEGMDEGTLIMCGLVPEDVIDSINTVVSQTKGDKWKSRIVADYDVDNVSNKVVRIIKSYIRYINRETWKQV